jgi:carbon starvation protein
VEVNAIYVLVGGLVIYLLGYWIYGKYLARRIFKLDADAPVPSRTMEDGVDYVPTNRYVLFGHHFASIAGAAPIVGPAVAVIWGWVPALLWVVFGAVLMGCVHDFSALVLSVRNKARSIGDIAGDLIGKKAVTAYMVIMFFVVVLLMAIFLRLIAGLLIDYPEVVFPAGALVVIALAIGLLIYRTRVGLGLASIAGIALMLASIWWGTEHPYSLPKGTISLWSNDVQLSFSPLGGWILMLAVYSFVASVLPVWLLLQPRDYLESFKLYAGLGLIFAGIIATGPTIVAPEVVLKPDGAPPIWPFLFVTIACGALTGFHSLVASGTTSKQLANEKDATFVGYGGMAAESALALCAVIACTAGFVTAERVPDPDGWLAHYGNWTKAGDLKLSAFVDNSAYFISNLGIPLKLGTTFIGLIVVAFALTTLDSACRLGRYILGEFGRQHRMPFLSDGYLASAIAAGVAFLLAVMPGVDPEVPVGRLLWPLFGTTNQLLAALVFATVTIYLVKRRTRHWFISIPLVLVAITTVSAMVWNIWGYVVAKNWILTGIGSVILLSGIALIVMACGAFGRARREIEPEPQSVAKD